jgi:PAS domain S-box-containing protein
VKAGLPDRAEDILTSILNIASEGVIVTDADLRVLVFSKGAEAIFGYTAGEVAGRSLELLIPPEFRDGHHAHVARFAGARQSSRRMQAREKIYGRTKLGHQVPLEVGLSKLETPGGMLFTAIVRDVSEHWAVEAALTRAAAEANAANVAKSGFLAAMGHEIRTPLNGVLGMAQAMAADDLPPKQRERLAVIRESGVALLALLNDLMDLSKIEAGRLVLEESEFDLEEVVGAVYGTFGALAQQKGLDLRLDVDPAARGRYWGDALRVRQILNNLISNAIKFTPSGAVDVGVRRVGRLLELSVRDTGVGVAADKLAAIFKPFEQADATTSRRFGGTGLGLSICKNLAEMMGGRIEVASVEGEGACFTAALALRRVAADRRQPASAAEARPSAVDAAALRVLVAEDNATNQLVIRTLLEQLGVETVVVPDGGAAVDRWSAESFDAILMDIQMPRVDGPTAASIIRAREAAEGLPRIPILALTANAMAHQRDEYIQAGMDGLIAKPIVLKELVSALTDLPRV